jgi:hypothetical protein
MSAQDNIQFYINWAKERLDEMEATLTSLEGKIGGVQDEVRGMAAKVLADLRKKRDEFRDVIMKNAEANEAAWIAEGKTGGRLEDVRVLASRSGSTRQTSSARLPPSSTPGAKPPTSSPPTPGNSPPSAAPKSTPR